MIQPGSKGLGLIRQQPDPRDFKLNTVVAPGSIFVPDKTSLKKFVVLGVDDQYDINWCQTHAGTKALEVAKQQQGLHPVLPSFNFTYKFARLHDGTQSGDIGATNRSMAKSLANEGLCPGWAWPNGRGHLDIHPGLWWRQQLQPWIKPPYDFQLVSDGNRYDIKQDPTYVAHHHQELGYYAVAQDVNAVRQALASGHGVVIGIEIRESFYGVDTSGFCPLPDPREMLYGYHSVYILGSDDNLSMGGYTGFFNLINSWGPQWGAQGYGWMPYAWWKPQPGIAVPFDAWAWHFAR